MKKFVLYTAIFGEPARFNFPEVCTPNVDRFCFTDFDIKPGIGQAIPVRNGRWIQNDFYQVKKMKLDSLTPVRRNRLVKLCIPDEIFNNYEYSLYVDCKRPFAFDLEQLLRCLNANPESDFLIRQHRRDCVYDEIEYLLKKRANRRNKKEIIRQRDFYRNEGYPIHNGLYAAFWLFRRHTKRAKEFSALWWEQLERFSHRDQVSLPYVAWKHGMEITRHKRSAQ